MNILFIDTETGGLNPYEHSLLEVALVAWKEGRQVGEIRFYVKQESYCVTEKAMEINQINLADVDAEGLISREAAEKIKSFVRERFGQEKPVLCGHNPSIDKYMIRHQLFDKNGLDMDEIISHRMIDTMSIIWALHLAGELPEKACSSTGAFEYFGITVPDRHTALGDCLATKELLKHLIDCMKGGKV